MFEILYKYLIVNKKASLPGIGVFHIQRQSASLDYTKQAFIAPSLQIAFTADANATDKKFYSFLSKEKQIEEDEAVQQINNFSKTITDDLLVKKQAEIPGFGLLLRGISGELRFQPETKFHSFFTDVPLERIVRNTPNKTVAEDKMGEEKVEVNTVIETQETNRNKKAFKWIIAIVLAVAAISAIIYYYCQNGSLL